MYHKAKKKKKKKKKLLILIHRFIGGRMRDTATGHGLDGRGVRV
jgi:hypothetical protein